MIHRRPKPKPPKRLPGDKEILRRRYAREMAEHVIMEDGDPGIGPDDAIEVQSTYEEYLEWLRSKGIDPETGRMTLDGLAFFKESLDAERLAKPKGGPRRMRPKA